MADEATTDPTPAAPGPDQPPATPHVDRTKHPIAKAIGAVYRGYREGDEKIRERVQGHAKRVGKLSIVVAALTLAGQVVSLLGEQMRHEWQQASEDRKALVAALDRQTEKLGAQNDKLGAQSERLGDLVDAIRADRARRDADHALIIDRVRAGGRR